MAATEFNDIWAALFKLRDAITDAENKLTSLSIPSERSERGNVRGKDATVAESHPSAASPVPANPGGSGVSLPPPIPPGSFTGASHAPEPPRNRVQVPPFIDDDGVPIVIGQIVSRTRDAQQRPLYFCGSCPSCGGMALSLFEPRKDMVGSYLCFNCYRSQREEAR